MRYKEIDIAKGIGITLVVLGHLTTPLHDYIYAFHMPLFFVLSGFFFSKNINLYKRSRILLCSYLFYYVTALIKSLLLVLVLRKTLSIETINPELINGPIWFIMALLWVTVIIWSLHKLIHNEYIVSAMSFSLFWIGYFISKVQITLPLYLTQALLMQLFYQIGYLAFNFQVHQEMSIFKYIVTSCLTKKICYILIAIIVIYYLNPHADIFLLKVDFPFNLILTSIAGTTALLCISTFNWGIISNMFNSLGKLSLHIMGFHKLLISPLYTYCMIPILHRFNNMSEQTIFDNQIITYTALIIIMYISYVWGKQVVKKLNFIFK